MTVHFTSDPHFGHRKVAALRGFGTLEEPDTAAHDYALIDRWQTTVREEDVVYVLGDLAASNPTHALDTLRVLPGRKRLVLGNHDKAHPMNRDAWKWTLPYADVFEFVAPFARVKVLGREVMLSHFPYERDRNEARYLQYRLRDEGLPLLHGHTHGEERLTVSTTLRPLSATRTLVRPRIEVHVGVDAWDLTPVSDERVAALLDEAA